MSTPTTPQLSRKPTRVYAYVALLFGLALLDVFGIIDTLDSESPIIRKLTPLRMAVLGMGVFCFSSAAILLLRRKAIGRWPVVAALVAHYGYMLYYNLLVLTKDGSPSSAAIFGMAFGMTVFLVLFAAVGVLPFTSKFSAHLKP